MSPVSAIAIRELKLLLVEGKDEVNFFTGALHRHLNLSGIQIIDYGGKARLTAFVRTLAADPGFQTITSIGVIRDADTIVASANIAAAVAALAAVHASLAAAGIPLPNSLAHGHFSTGPPRVGAFIMPDGQSDGMLETLCMAAVAADPTFACVNDFFACCAGAGAVPGNMHKARAHAWLATRSEPDKRLGEAALSGYWPFTSACFGPLWAFLRAL